MCLIFKTLNVSLYQSKANLNVKIFFRESFHLLDLEIRKTLVRVDLRVKIPHSIFGLDLVALEILILFMKKAIVLRVYNSMAGKL